MRILVTGASGSIGTALCPALTKLGHQVVATDRDTLDVTDPAQVARMLRQHRPDAIYHLAADKHAPWGEDNPGRTAAINLNGTQHILAHAAAAKVVLASTCKAADPETVYGASKLIAERIVLNAAGVVVRFFNVRETSGNVFRIWERLPADAPIPVTDCWRYFISLDRAVWLATEALTFPTGRYALDPGVAVRMRDEAARLYPGRRLIEIPRRRGDRLREPLQAACETVREHSPGVFRIESPHDPAAARAEGIAA